MTVSERDLSKKKVPHLHLLLQRLGLADVLALGLTGHLAPHSRSALQSQIVQKSFETIETSRDGEGALGAGFLGEGTLNAGVLEEGL